MRIGLSLLLVGGSTLSPHEWWLQWLVVISLTNDISQLESITIDNPQEWFENQQKKRHLKRPARLVWAFH